MHSLICKCFIQCFISFPSTNCHSGQNDCLAAVDSFLLLDLLSLLILRDSIMIQISQNHQVQEVATPQLGYKAHIYHLQLNSCTVLVGKACDDINECLSSVNNDCDPVFGTCINRVMSAVYPLGYSCSCSTGYQISADGFTCIDINECT